MYERFRELCLSFPETTEVFVEAWGHPTFRLGPKAKMFASCSAPDDPRRTFGLKLEMAHQQALVATDPRVSVSKYVGRYGWVTVQADGPLDWDEVREWVAESYRLNAPRRLAR